MTDVTVREQIRRLRELRYEQEGAELGEVSESLSASAEFRDLCLEIADEAVEREHQAEAIDARIAELQARKARLVHTAETLRNVVLQCMEIKGEKTISSPLLTLTAAARKPDVVVTDESAIPSRFFVTPPPKLDKKALREAVVGDGEVVPGAALGNGRSSLTIRRK